MFIGLSLKKISASYNSFDHLLKNFFLPYLVKSFKKRKPLFILDSSICSLKKHANSAPRKVTGLLKNANKNNTTINYYPLIYKTMVTKSF